MSVSLGASLGIGRGRGLPGGKSAFSQSNDAEEDDDDGPRLGEADGAVVIDDEEDADED